MDFLLSLQMGEENCQASMDRLSERDGFALATPSVMQQLADLAKNSPNEAFREAAGKTLRSIATWNVLTPELGWKEHALADSAAKKICEKGLCGNYQRALVLAEAAITKSRILLTSHPVLLEIEDSVLTLLLVENHLPECSPIPPLWFAHWFSEE
ncbi:MAG TPA: hypothetical protein VHE13_05860 [Opitutus sp.]|nr:hypothetical protein [Opitutus sp.]